MPPQLAKLMIDIASATAKGGGRGQVKPGAGPLWTLLQYPCPFPKLHPAWIRVVRQNHRIIRADACDPAPAPRLEQIGDKHSDRVLRRRTCFSVITRHLVFDCAAAPAASSCFVCSVLQSRAHALGVGQGCAPGSGGPAVRCHCRYPNLGRAAPPIRPDMIFGKDKCCIRRARGTVWDGRAAPPLGIRRTQPDAGGSRAARNGRSQ